MKSYTDLKQSKKLAEILPKESADMRYGYIAPYDYSDRMYDGGYDEVPYPKDFLKKNPNFSENEYDGELPCWSLAALMEVLPNKIISHETAFDDEDAEGITDIYYKRIESTEDNCYVCLYAGNGYKYKCTSDNLVDVCVEMIIKLNELKML